MNKTRRKFLLQTLGIGIFLSSWQALAAWPKNFFSMDNMSETLSALTQGKPIQDKGVELIVPGIAENGGQVRVEVKTSLKDTQKIFILAEKNPLPLVAQFNLNSTNIPTVALNVKLSGTSNITALVETTQGFYRADQEVSVTAGGCA